MIVSVLSGDVVIVSIPSRLAGGATIFPQSIIPDALTITAHSITIVTRQISR
jgi:hypothetical protein